MAKDPLERWLELDWQDVERSYNPDLQLFLSHLLGYPRRYVKVDASGAGGLPDIQLLTAEGDVWVVGDLKKDDAWLTDRAKRRELWDQKKKYVAGLVRHVLFVTPRHMLVLDPQGNEQLSIELEAETTETLREKLAFLSYEHANHERLWKDLTSGRLAYSYLELDEQGVRRLKEDLVTGFEDLLKAAERSFKELERRYEEYQARRKELVAGTGWSPDAYNRALARLDSEHAPLRHLFTETLPQFAEQYGRELKNDKGELDPRIREAFLIDSVAALVARVLFVRLIEDLGLTGRRRLTNGGPLLWSQLVEHLAGSATALLRLSSEDLSQLYKEPFEDGFFGWILETNGGLDEALQKLILRLNAYDFKGLSEEILGDIYQSFLPPAKRKRLGEVYTPASVVDYILAETALRDPGPILDPASGSGSFLVRYVHARLEEARQRGIDPEIARKELQEEVWGFDLNPFASFITLFQLMWALLRYHPSGEPPKIHVYTLNSVLRDSEMVIHEGLAPEGEVARDTRQWRYVVGNPPYIRAERVKYGDEVKNLWSEVWGKNADTGLLFLYRAMKDWLEPEGKLGFVVSGGYASSDAAAPIWRLLHPGGELSLRKVVWLEFVPQIWDAAVIPMVLIIEKRPPNEEDVVELWTPSGWPKEPDEHEVARIPYAAFFDTRVNPTSKKKLSAQASEYGEYLQPLLREGDLPLLRRLHPSVVGSIRDVLVKRTSRNNQEFWWTYGIQRGGVEVTDSPKGKRPVRVFGGSSIAMAWPGEAVGWVDLDAVGSKPYGKLSLWGGEAPGRFIAVAEIARLPYAALMPAGNNAAATNSVVVAESKHGHAEAVAGYINSALVSWYYAVRLRSGVLAGSRRSHIYPRSLESLPWPAEPDAQAVEDLKQAYLALEEAARRTRENPAEQLRERILALGPDELQPLHKIRELDFRRWEDEPAIEEIYVSGRTLQGNLFASIEFPDEDLALLVHILIQGMGGERLKRKDLQKIVVPKDYKRLMAEYHEAMRSFEGAREDFMRTLEALDEAAFDLFDLDPEEREYIRTRLNTFPLDQLRPRFPWEAVKPRPIKAYTEDRWS